MVKSSQTKSLTSRRDGEAKRQTHQMCLIHGEFKHFATPITNHFQLCRKVSSIMSAKLLSIMPPDARRVTSD
jgi:hypothetical protein